MSDIVRNENDFKEKLKVDKLYTIAKDGNLVIDHVRTAETMVKFIQLVPMSHWHKKVLIMRISSPLLNQRSMSTMQIALRLGCLENEVLEIEEEGKQIVMAYLQKVTSRDFIEKFERDRSLRVAVNDVFNQTKVNPGELAAEGENDVTSN